LSPRIVRVAFNGLDCLGNRKLVVSPTITKREHDVSKAIRIIELDRAPRVDNVLLDRLGIIRTVTVQHIKLVRVGQTAVCAA
jgi:hypothetical protein